MVVLLDELSMCTLRTLGEVHPVIPPRQSLMIGSIFPRFLTMLRLIPGLLRDLEAEAILLLGHLLPQI